MITRAIETLKNSTSLFVLTGAGISAASGIPTFRGKDGLWKKHRALDLATPQAFNNNPALVWEWYHWRQKIILRSKPNPAHVALVELETKVKEYLLLTQNVDNLHQRAGSRHVLELHGNIFRTQCIQCGIKASHADIETPFVGIPKCSCGGMLRPDVVWFGEPIPPSIWQTTVDFLNKADTVIICGTSGVVWPAAALPEMAKSKGSTLIEINIEATPISQMVDIFLGGKSSEILPKIAAGI